MKCIACNRTAYAVRMKTVNNKVDRIYRCRDCGKVFNTVEIGGEFIYPIKDEIDKLAGAGLSSESNKKEKRERSIRDIRYDFRMNQFEADLLEYLSSRTEKSRPQVIREALELYYRQSMLEDIKKTEMQEKLCNNIAD